MTDIYFFSATGNSLSVAKAVARHTDGRLIPMASLTGRDTIRPEADTVGIVFPVYYSQLPVLVKEFVSRLTDIHGKYVFAVCTFGGAAGRSFWQLRRLIASRGAKLCAGFGVQMPQNAFFKPKERRPALFEKSAAAALRIAGCVQMRRHGTFYASLFSELLMLCMHPLILRLCRDKFAMLSGMPASSRFDELVRQSDRSFAANDKCARCGLCARVCPESNIRMTDARPVWLHRCTHCLACYHWCPQKAIENGIVQKGYYYRHPKVTVSAIIPR